MKHSFSKSSDTEPLGPMALIHGGKFWMGANNSYPEEAPERQVSVGSFWIDRTPVTNAEFQKFADETGFVTTAEQVPSQEEYPDALPEMLRPGSAMFARPTGRSDRQIGQSWWKFTFGCDWRHPAGPDSSITLLQNHPVVHVSYHDAAAYALWAGKALPTEAEWEFAARGGLIRKKYAWGNQLTPKKQLMANYWQGQFPSENTLEDGYEGTSPVGAFPANGFGLFDMIGNVWEWTSDWFEAHVQVGKTCCVPNNPKGGDEQASREDGQGFPRKVLKGGSHLCADNYCRRYRPAARHPQTIDTSTSHIGFRCVRRIADL